MNMIRYPIFQQIACLRTHLRNFFLMINFTQIIWDMNEWLSKYLNTLRMRGSQMKKKHKPANWKKRFIILITINIVLIVLFVMFVYSPIPKTELEESSQEYKSENSSEFIVRTTKQNVNNLVNAYIDKLLANSKHDYTI